MIRVENCEAPLRQWSLLRHVRCLEWLYIEGCSDLTCSSNDDLLRCLRSLETLRVINCNSIVALPELLGDLTALEQLEVRPVPTRRKSGFHGIGLGVLEF